MNINQQIGVLQRELQWRKSNVRTFEIQRRFTSAEARYDTEMLMCAIDTLVAVRDARDAQTEADHPEVMS
jgi:hypothetical protein